MKTPPPRRHAPPPRNVRFTRLESPGGSPTRHFERLFLKHRGLNAVLSESAKWFLACMIWPRFVAPYRWQLTRYPLPLAHLHPAFHGYKILQLTDLHVGKTRVEYLASVFDQCMKEKPDLVVLTGDLIDYQPAALPLLKTLLPHLTRSRIIPPTECSRFSAITIITNIPGAIPGRVRRNGLSTSGSVRIVEEQGIRLLRNQQHRIMRPIPVPSPSHAHKQVSAPGFAGGKLGLAIESTLSQPDPPAEPGADIENAIIPPPLSDSSSAAFTVVGIDEMWTGRANAQHAFHGLSPADPVLCLQHNPDGIEFLKPFPWQFMLCGHSHGGQANFPVVGPLYVPMEHRQYLRGHFHFPPLPGQALDHRTMFVSTGLGHSTPIRLRCAPEATLFTLEPARAITAQ